MKLSLRISDHTLPAGLMLAAATAIIAATTACGPPLPPSKPLDQLTQQEMSGHDVFQAHCAKCHYPNTSGSLQGPGLQAMFKQPYLPSGAPANDERVSIVIRGGRNMMPATRDLDQQQLEDLMAYLHTL